MTLPLSAMGATTNIVTSPYFGGTRGTPFSDPVSIGDLPAAAINKIVVRSCLLIDCLEVYYSWNKGVGITHGGTGGGRHEFTLEPDEFITRIHGQAEEACISRLTFTTNKSMRKLGPFGGTTGTCFSFGSTNEADMKLLAFSGRTSHLLVGLQAVFAEYREHSLKTAKTAKYERMPALPQADSPLPGISKFTLHLMSPIVTLFVGQSEQKIEFHACEDTLCQLPFFKAALLGGFKEAAQKIINLPKDDPKRVSALIEYLYTKNYTYTYDSTAAHFEGESNIPIGDLAEGLFHVGVYAIATKYICPGLAEGAMANLKAVLDELGDIDKLRLWKAAYDEGIYLQGRKSDFQQYRSGEGFMEWVGGLFREHSEEMETTISEYPVLACDLLRVMAGQD